MSIVTISRGICPVPVPQLPYIFEGYRVFTGGSNRVHSFAEIWVVYKAEGAS